MEYFESRSSSLKPSHVYISFRGDEDTRKFIHSLSAALKAQGFRIFGDDKKRETGVSNLPDHLRKAIDESWIWIVVFSKNYASSSWCLQELAQFAGCRCDGTAPRRIRLQRPVIDEREARFEADIDETWTLELCRLQRPVIDEREARSEADINKVNRWRQALKQGFRLSGRWSVRDRIIPVYYDVDPKSFAQHIQQTYTQCCEAIKQVTTLSGWHVRSDSRSQVIQKIVKQVKSKIDQEFYDFFRFVGIQSQVEEVEKLLDLSTDDDEVRVVGICGMGGLGKSSIATVLYLKIFHYFDAFCFLPNVSGCLRQGDLSLQELLHRHLRTENSERRGFLDKVFLGCKSLRKHKFLIVLDGIDLGQHLEELNLVEKSNCFGGGSRIIITTRDEQVLQKYEVDTVYRPKFLSKDEAFKLFCSKAFPKEYPVSDFKEMIYRILEYANGLPLAIEILGSSLFGKGVVEWRTFLDREEIIPPDEIIRVLRKSFDELDGISKDMFLDIACFFVGKDVDYVKEILHDCISCCVDIRIKLLIQKSLITIVNQRIQMHGILRAMGREIVRRQCPNQPNKRSRLYLFSDIKYIMEKEINTRMHDVEAIALDLEGPRSATLRIEALSHMINLRLLIFRNVNFLELLIIFQVSCDIFHGINILSLVYHQVFSLIHLFN